MCVCVCVFCLFFFLAVVYWRCGATLVIGVLLACTVSFLLLLVSFFSLSLCLLVGTLITGFVLSVVALALCSPHVWCLSVPCTSLRSSSLFYLALACARSGPLKHTGGRRALGRTPLEDSRMGRPVSCQFYVRVAVASCYPSLPSPKFRVPSCWLSCMCERVEDSDHCEENPHQQKQCACVCTRFHLPCPSWR